ncbi:MAG: hypothetical protein QOH06_502 [Acidobacteriota bacterium]|nr:hypothetical protein [Acidobacteriota bacterium]
MKRALCVVAWLLSLFAAVGVTAQEDSQIGGRRESGARPSRVTLDQPIELTLRRAGSTSIDLRELPQTRPVERDREELPDPPFSPMEAGGGRLPSTSIPSVTPGANAPAPAPIITFEGLDRFNWGSGSPPDTVGDVGPDHYIQSVNSSVGIYNKTTGAQITAFTFDTLMSQGSFGNLCDNENFGDPVVLYDTFEDRWVLTDFAFLVDGAGLTLQPAFQCFAVSKTADPVAGGWWFYSVQITDQLNDYPKLGVWTDGIYMSANMFSFNNSGGFQFVRVWAFNKAQMYAGEPAVQVVSFETPSDFANGLGDFTVIPSNARLQTGTPPPGTPNYFLSSWVFLDGLTVYQFHVDWDRISLSTFTGPDVPLAATQWPNQGVANPGQPGTAQLLDALQIRAMMQNQYTNFGGTESLWNTHTVRRALNGLAAPRWYQVDVTGGAVNANIPQAATWDPDAANVINRFMPSLALDRDGNLALGYSTSHTTAGSFPSIKYAGRLAADPINTFSQTEQTMFTGTASQTTSARWGDYAAMTLDPEDGCTFWFTTEFANPVSQVANMRWRTQVGSFKYAGCTPVGAGGTLSGTVTATVGGAPISGAQVKFGSRTTTTNGSGVYSFTSIPAGSYPSEAVSAQGFVPESAAPIAVTDGGTTTQDFALDKAPLSGCPTDTTLADFQLGVQSNVDLTTSPDEVELVDQVENLNQKNTTLGNTGGLLSTTNWNGQTFTPSVTGPMTRVDVKLFCLNCTGTTPNLTLALRATTGGLPTGADLASATLTGFNDFAQGFWHTVNFATPPVLTSGTQYAIVLRATANPSAGTYNWLRSGGAVGADVYAGGTRVSSANSGGTWTVTLATGVSVDMGFKVYIDTGFTSGNQVSSLKDANPQVGYPADWTTLSWTAATPTNTTVRFQVAASNSLTGPFNFVGPDTTAGTFFTTTGASLDQFDGNRYLKYKVYLSSTDNNVTPTLNDVAVCFAAPPPELSITKSDGGASVAPGGTVSYTLTYGNNSVGGATGVVLTDTVPANATFNAGASTAGWSCTPDNNAGSTCTLAIGAVAGSSSGLTATFAVTVINPVGAGVTQISNTASIADDGANGTDPTPGNNSASDTTPVTAAPDLSITKSDGGADVEPGGTISYTLTYANNGNEGATGVVITDIVPANTTFDSGASTAGWSCTPDDNAGSTCTLTVGALAAGGGNQVATFAVTVDDPRPTGLVQISNTASIADDGANGTDPTPGNNSGSDTTLVVGLDYYTIVPPCRLLDTRTGPGTPITGAVETEVATSGLCSIPADAVALALNVTVIDPSNAGHIEIYPTAGARPFTSTVNFATGQVRPNNAIVTLETDGTFQVYFVIPGPGNAHLAVDVVGYFK